MSSITSFIGCPSSKRFFNLDLRLPTASYNMGHFHKKGQITVKTWRSIFNPVGTRYLCISIDISMPFDTYVLEKIINAYNLYYY